MQTSAPFEFYLLDSNGQNAATRELPVEVPVELAINGQAIAVVMLTPADLADFARGFCLSERLIPDSTAVTEVTVVEFTDHLRVNLKASKVNSAALRAQQQRSLRINSSCGLCGQLDLQQILEQIPVLRGSSAPDFESLQRALNQLREAQILNARTHAVHAAAWADQTGDLLCVREDLGRHNALDKLIGARAGLPTEQGFCVLTSRCSYEMVQKAASAGFATLVAISAPSALAVELARKSRMRLIALARPDSVAVFNSP